MTTRYKPAMTKRINVLRQVYFGLPVRGEFRVLSGIVVGYTPEAYVVCYDDQTLLVGYNYPIFETTTGMAFYLLLNDLA